MRRSEFVFCIGYSGGTAIIDRRLFTENSRFTSIQLAEKGLFKPALAGALWDENPQDQAAILEIFNQRSPQKIASVEILKRALGVGEVFKTINRTSYL